MHVETVHRITGPHLLINGMGAAMWLHDVSKEELDRICIRVALAARDMSFGEPKCTSNDMGYAIAIRAPIDQLYAACTLLEWSVETSPWDEKSRAAVVDEEPINIPLRTLYSHCVEQGISYTVDEDAFFLGYGIHTHSFALDAIPTILELPSVESIPTVGITGTNGKTTTTRMLASIAKEAGFCVGSTSSDGVVIDEEWVVRGDWTGAGAARKVLRDARVDFAILETARGGLMRRGMVIQNTDIVGITNVSRDHFGSWGINSLRALQRAKLSIVRSLKKRGVLVLNKADHDLYELFMKEFAPKRLDITIAFYSFVPEEGALAYCLDGDVYLKDTRICSVEDIPLSLGGHARYNIENALMAIVLAHLQGIGREEIRSGLCRLLPDPIHSQGRSNIFSYRGAQVILDFAHNEAGVRAMANLVHSMNPTRSFMILGQAGDRDLSLLKGMAEAAAELHCARYFIKRIAKNNEERSAQETALKLQEFLISSGIEEKCIEVCIDELEAANTALSVIKPNDILLLLTHTHYEDVLTLLRS
jgi:cyanophycin synthetase